MLGNVIDLFFKYAELKQDVNAQLRLIYLECVRNLDLLDTINIDAIEGQSLSPVARKIVSGLDFSMLYCVRRGQPF